jgi:glycosyltransferase involved in cell wall biosynthesis
MITYELTKPYEASDSFLPHAGLGMARRMYELMKYLVRMGESECIKFDILMHGPSHKNILLRNLKRLPFFSRVRKAVASLYYADTPILALPLAIFNKHPFIVTVHDALIIYPDYSNFYEARINRTYLSYVLHRADKVVTKAHFWKRVLTRNLHIPSGKIEVVYNGVNTNVFMPISKPENRLRWRKKRVLYIGTPTRTEGLRVLLEAFASVGRQRKDVEFLLGGKQSRYIMKMCMDLRSKGINIRTLGFIPEDKLSLIYNMSHVYVHPPFDETSLMLLESMACGTPVIAREMLEIPEYVGDAGVLIKSPNAEEISDVILNILSDEELWLRLSYKSIDRAKRFTWQRTAEEMFKIILQLI